MINFIHMAAIAIALTGCVTTSYNSPEVQQEFKQTQRTINSCLSKQLVKLVQVHDDPNTLAQVAADRCHYTALQETQRLKKVNTSKAYIRGFTNKLTNKEELQSRALNILMLLIQEANN